MSMLSFPIDEKLNALLQAEAARHDQSLEATVRGLLLSKMREVETARAALRLRLDAARRAFEDAKARGENEVRLAELDEAIDEVLDDFDCFELDLQEPTKPEDCVPWAQVKAELEAKMESDKVQVDV